MKRRITALLTALALSLGVALPAASPALATALAPVLNLETWDPVSEWHEASFGLSAENSEGLTIALQTLEGGTWKTVWVESSYSEYEYFSPSYTFTEQKSLDFRAVAMEGTQMRGISNTVTITYRLPATIEPAEWATLTYLPDTTVGFTVTNAKNSAVVVERRSGTSWVKHWTSPAQTTDTAAMVKAPLKFSAAGTGTYRAHVYRDGQAVATSFETTVTYQKPTVRLHTSTPDYNPTKTFSMASEEAAGFSYQLQRWDGTVWRAVSTSSTMKTTADVKASYRIPAEGTVKFRAALLHGGKLHAVSPTMDAKYARQASKVEPHYWNEGKPFANKEGRIAASEVASQVWYVNTQLSNRYGSLQELRNGKWVIVQNLSWKTNTSWRGPAATVKSTRTMATVKKTYRIVVNSTAYEKGWVSKSSTISHENPRHYTGYKKTAYDYMKKYCPNQVITLKSPGASLAHDPSYRIEIAKGMPKGKGMQFVSLHECAHIISFKLYKNSGALDKRMNQIYKTRIGSEHLADCMARAMGGDIRNAIYTKNCSGYRGTAAKMVLQGKKP